MKLKTLLFALITLIFSTACNNDDGNAPNANVCNFQGLSVEDANGNTILLIPDANFQTDMFINPNNGGPLVEIFDFNAGGNSIIITNAINLGDVDSNAFISIQGTTYTGIVTNQRSSNTVGGELRLDLVINGLGEAELCVLIDTAN